MKQFIDYSFTSRHRHSKSKSIYKDDLKVDTWLLSDDFYNDPVFYLSVHPWLHNPVFLQYILEPYIYSAQQLTSI